MPEKKHPRRKKAKQPHDAVFKAFFSDVLYETRLVSGSTDWVAFIPNFHYLLTDLSQMPLQTIEEKGESSYLTNLLLALKMYRDEQLIRENLEKILTFGKPFYRDNREGILLQVLTVYLFKVTNMTSVEFNEVK